VDKDGEQRKRSLETDIKNPKNAEPRVFFSSLLV